MVWQGLLRLSQENAAAAADNLGHDPPRPSVAYAEARHAAELAAKALLSKARNRHPRTHAVGAILYQEGLLPADLDPAATDHALRQATRGEYGLLDVPSEAEVRQMIRLALRLVRAAAEWPAGAYHREPGG